MTIALTFTGDVSELTLREGDRLVVATTTPATPDSVVARIHYNGNPASLTFDAGSATSAALTIESRAYRRHGPAKVAHMLNRRQTRQP